MCVYVYNYQRLKKSTKTAKFKDLILLLSRQKTLERIILRNILIITKIKTDGLNSKQKEP